MAKNSRSILLILGVSGVGKSTIVRKLQTIDSRFVYVRQSTTRSLRKGECEKIQVNEYQMDVYEASRDYCVIKTHYSDKTIRYALCYSEIMSIVSRKKYAIVDWAVSRMDALDRARVLNNIFSVYLIPPSDQELQRRLNSEKRNNYEERLEKSRRELYRFQCSDFEGKYSMSIVCNDADVVASDIYWYFTHSAK